MRDIITMKLKESAVVWAFILSLPAVIPSTIFAADNVANNAIRCACIFSVLATLPETAPLAPTALFMSEMYAVHEGERIGRSLNISEVDQAVGEAKISFVDLYDRNPEKVVNEALWCDEWRISIGEYLEKNGFFDTGGSPSEEEVRKMLIGVTVPTGKQNIYNKQSNQMRQVVITTAFDAWIKQERLRISREQK